MENNCKLLTINSEAYRDDVRANFIVLRYCTRPITDLSLLYQKQNTMKTICVKEKSTGNFYYANYGPNRLGNLQLWVNGSFYSDKNFAKHFNIIPSEEYERIDKSIIRVS